MNPMRSGIDQAALDAPQLGSDGQLTRQFRFPASFVGFDGHFPGFPILPGVVQLLLVQLLIEAGTGRPWQLREVANAKFLQQLPPGATLAVSCRPRTPGDREWWSGRIDVEGRPAATFQLRGQERR